MAKRKQGRSKPTRDEALRRRKTRQRPESLREQAARIEEQAEQDFAAGKYAIGLAKLDDVLTEGVPTARTWLLCSRGLLASGEYVQAIDAARRALHLQAGLLEASFNLASARYRMGEVDQAVALFRTFVESSPSLSALVNLATIIPGAPMADNQAIFETRVELGRRLRHSIEADLKLPTIPPVAALEGRRIRIGYISAFFHRENYMKPVANLIQAHDREHFEIHLFSDFAADEDVAWFEPQGGDQLHVTTSLDNGQLMRLIAEQQLDVMVDLNGYSAPSRLSVLTQRLAPLSVAWFNMYATSGLSGLDLIVGDPWVIPKEEERFYTEEVCRLPVSYLSFSVTYDARPVAEAPSSRLGTFTFGSLVSQYKVTPEMYDIWTAILRRVPDSRFVLSNRTLGSAANREWVLGQFVSRGIGADRIDLREPAAHQEFLRYYDDIDLALDTLPYNGGTTTTEALWQGVPVLTTQGDRWASRTSRTLLENAGLEEFVVADDGEYVSEAVRWATDDECRKQLTQLRAGLREQLQGSPVCDGQQMARAWESLLVEKLEELAKSK